MGTSHNYALDFSKSKQVKDITLENTDQLCVILAIPEGTPEMKSGLISVAPMIDGSAGLLDGVISTKALSLTDPMEGYRSGSSTGQHSSIGFTVGFKKDFQFQMEAGKTYFMTVRVHNPAPTQNASKVFIEYNAPKAKRN